MKKKSDWLPLPSGDFKHWFGQYVMSSLAMKFYQSNKRFPVAFRRESIKIKGRSVVAEMR